MAVWALLRPAGAPCADGAASVSSRRRVGMAQPKRGRGLWRRGLPGRCSSRTICPAGQRSPSSLRRRDRHLQGTPRGARPRERRKDFARFDAGSRTRIAAVRPPAPPAAPDLSTKTWDERPRPASWRRPGISGREGARVPAMFRQASLRAAGRAGRRSAPSRLLAALAALFEKHDARCGGAAFVVVGVGLGMYRSVHHELAMVRDPRAPDGFTAAGASLLRLRGGVRAPSKVAPGLWLAWNRKIAGDCPSRAR